MNLYETFNTEMDVDAVARVIRRGTYWVKGPEITEFENLVAEFVGSRFAVCFNSGTSGLYAMCKTLSGGRDEVIIPSFTFMATANSVVSSGLRPVFADIEEDTLSLSLESVKQAVNKRTKAVMVMHYLGNVARDINQIRQFCMDEGLVLLEDAAHAFGAYDTGGQYAGTFGSAGMFSFSFNKIMSTGEGGCVVTDDEQVMKQLRLVNDQGRDTDGSVVYPGMNLRMSSLTAALGTSQMAHVEELIERRRMIADLYEQELKDTPVKTPKSFGRCVFQRYTIQTEYQNDLIMFLKKHGIPCSKGYTPVHQYPVYQNGVSLPVTEKTASELVTLPFHPLLSENDVLRVCGKIKDFFQMVET